MSGIESFLPVIGGVLGGLFGGGDSTTTSVQKADPWEGVQPALKELYSGALSNYQSGGPQYYPGSTIAPQSPTTQLAQQGIYNLATNPSPVLQMGQQQAYSTLMGDYLNQNPGMQDLYNFAGQDFMQGSPAMQQLGNTASGQMLNSNPYLDQMFGKASSAVGRQFSNNVMPGVASMFAGGGRYGSNQMAEGLGQAQQQYGNTLNDLATQIYGGNYSNERQLQQGAQTALGQFGLQGRGQQIGAAGAVGGMYGDERNRQMGAVSQAPGLDQADYFGMGALANVGAAQDAYNQSVVTGDVNRYNFGQQAPDQQLQQLAALLYGYPKGKSDSVTQPGSPLAGAMSGFNIGQGLLNTFNQTPAVTSPFAPSSTPTGSEGDWYNMYW
jgi:hypothetical protein